MMEMKQYLIDTFQYNDRANRQALEAISLLPEKDSCVRFFSHMINSMRKWMARIMEYPRNPEMSWWEPVYPFARLEQEWDNCLQAWIEFLSSKRDEEMAQDVLFVGYDGSKFSARLQDIALQLNYHSIHHRAQIQAIIRAQGFDAPFVDYIGTVYKKLD